jgi:hypothetical protein
MTSNVHDFNRRVLGFSGAIPEEIIGPVMKRAGFETLRGTVFGTPVITGRLRGGWMLTVGQPTDDEGPPDAAGTGAIGSGQAELRAWRPFDTIYLQNSVNYASYVEHGTDRMAPRKMMQRAIDAVVATLPVVQED